MEPGINSHALDSTIAQCPADAQPHRLAHEIQSIDHQPASHHCICPVGGSICRAADPPLPICFTNEPTAFTNGQTLLAAVKAGDAQSKKQVEALIGARVLFHGSRWGTNANLKLGDRVFLEVELNPAGEVRPHAALWQAEVVGILQAVDFGKRVIRIQVQPEEWKAYQVR